MALNTHSLIKYFIPYEQIVLYFLKKYCHITAVSFCNLCNIVKPKLFIIIYFSSKIVFSKIVILIVE